MKKAVHIILFVAFSLLATVLHTEPFLLSGPYTKGRDQPTDFSIVTGKLSLLVPAEKVPDGTVRLKLDLTQFPDGEHLLKIKAVNTPKRIESEIISVNLVKKNEKGISIKTPHDEPPPTRERAR